MKKGDIYYLSKDDFEDGMLKKQAMLNIGDKDGSSIEDTYGENVEFFEVQILRKVKFVENKTIKIVEQK